MINRQLVHFDTAGNRVIINPGEMTNTGGDNWDITPSGYVPWTSATSADVPNTVALRDADGGFSVGNLQIDTTPPVIQTDGVGKLVWNDTDGTIQFLLKGGNVTMNVGEREVTRVRNADVAPMTPGQVVYLFGSTGSHKEVKLANASAEATSSGTIGVVAEPIAVNQEGYIITTGVLRDINTLALTQGAPVWLSTVTGQMTSTRPNAPNHGVVVGFCVRQHATVGAVYVKVDNGWELDELHNVYISGVANGDLLVYNAANTRWQNLPVASQPWVLKAGDTMTGSLTMGNGASLILSGGAAYGQGNIRMGAAASNQYDSNVVYADTNTRTMGYVCSSTPAFLATYGPYFGLRGNSYTAVPNQRGALFLSAGNVASPIGLDGCFSLLTGNDVVRLFVNPTGKIAINTGSVGAGLVHVGGSYTATSLIDSIFGVKSTYVAMTNGDAYGLNCKPVFTKAASGTHAFFVGALMEPPTIGGGAATVSTATTLYVAGAPTGASNNYALWVSAGTSRIDSKLSLGLTATATTARLHIAGGTATAGTAPLKFTSGTLMTTAEAGAVEFLTDKAYLTITTGAARKELTLNDTALTAGQAPTITTNGRLTNSNKFDIYATGTTNGTAGSVVNLNIVPMPTNGELRFLRITVKALSAAAPPDSFGRTLDAMWANAAGVLTQVGADQLGTALTTGNLAAATIATTAAGTNVRVTCTDVTGCGAVVTWQVFGEYY